MCKQFQEGYKQFLDQAKTEKEVIRKVLGRCKAAGFRRFTGGFEQTCHPGEKWIHTIRGKGAVIAVAGRRPLRDGVKIVAAHTDSPRLDLKPVPVCEEDGFVYLKTHYYGGMKLYQWMCIPLALHGSAVDARGNVIDLSVGEKDGDPVFYISDLLPHLSPEWKEQKAGALITGEQMALLAGMDPSALYGALTLNGDQRVDFRTAEFEAVPAQKASDIGMDRRMTAAYGQDDRSCVYAALEALLGCSEIPEYTCALMLSDQEETGSESSAGLYSEAFLEMLDCMARQQGTDRGRMMAKAECLSADVVCGYDPVFPEVTDRQNTAHLGKGMTVSRYTGRGGKKGNHSASAAFLAKFTSVLDDNQVEWQCGEMGAVDAGGGTTVSKCMARWGAEVLDVGIPLLSMHSPMEVSAKADLWNLYRGIRAFFLDRSAHWCDTIIY